MLSSFFHFIFTFCLLWTTRTITNHSHKNKTTTNHYTWMKGLLELSVGYTHLAAYCAFTFSSKLNIIGLFFVSRLFLPNYCASDYSQILNQGMFWNNIFDNGELLWQVTNVIHMQIRVNAHSHFLMAEVNRRIQMDAANQTILWCHLPYRLEPLMQQTRYFWDH